MKNLRLSFLFAFLLLGCNDSSIKEGNALSLNRSKPTQVNLNFEEGYKIDFEGEEITPLINFYKDTISTGTKNQIEPVLVLLDTMTAPHVYEATEFDQMEKSSLHPNYFLFSAQINPVKFLDNDFSKPNKNSIILNTSGDTVITNTELPFVGVELESNYPQSKLALPLRMKENATSTLQYLDVDQGLVSSYVNNILFDKSGNLWVATLAGVSKYDGVYITNYTSENGLEGNTIYCMMQSKDGNIWFGGTNGVFLYDGHQFTNFNDQAALSHDVVNYLFEDSKGNIWIAGDEGGLSVYNGTTVKHYSEKEGLIDNNVLSILEDHENNLWIGTFKGVSKFDGEYFTNYNSENGFSDYVWSLIEDKENNIWMTGEDGVYKFDGLNVFHYGKEQGLDVTCQKIIEDNNGQIWVGTDSKGVCKIEDNKLIQYSVKEGLTSDQVWALETDDSGNLWVGTYGGGVCVIKESKFTHLTYNQGFIHGLGFSIFEDKEGFIWLGSNFGVYKTDGDFLAYYGEENGLNGNLIRDIDQDSKGRIWIATYYGGVVCYADNLFTHYTKKQGLVSDVIRTVTEDHAGNIWFGGNDGISMFDGTSFTNYVEKNGYLSYKTNHVIVDVDGILWFGTDDGLVKYDGTDFQFFTTKEGLSHSNISTVIEDKNGGIWIATEGGGLNFIQHDKITYITEREGLKSNRIGSLVQDDLGVLWAGSDEGLNRVSLNRDSSNQITSCEVQIYQAIDGLKSTDLIGDPVIDSKNNLWMCGGKGTEILNLSAFKISQNPPKLKINQVDVNQEFIDFRMQAENDNSNYHFEHVIPFSNLPQNLVLPYHKNHLTFYFSGIDWNAQHKVKYAYKLKGLETGWSKPSSSSLADYRGLNHGSYTFMVAAIGESGEWSDPVEYRFKITPPWWLTWWFKLLIAIIFLVFIAIIIKWRTAKLQQRQKELEREIEIATSEIRSQKLLVEKQRDEVQQQKIVIEQAHFETEKQKEIIEETHKEITDSIAYAERLQKAILPSVEQVNQCLEEAFILFKPKDVVSGDFYWLEVVEDTIFIAAADCTGHGVPGALVSVVCSNSLFRSVNEFKITEPAKILDKTRDLVIKTFAKSGDEVKDGMDISLCAIKGDVLTYAGANNPLWIVREKDLEIRESIEDKSITFLDELMLIEFKANKQPVGLYSGMQDFTQETFQLKKGDTVYLFTDGFPDQFGGEKGKKFKHKPFKNLLLEIHHEPVEKKREIIDTTFEKWKGQLEQVDDVCIIGIHF